MTKHIIRPEFEIEYVGLVGFLLALYSIIFKIGIKKVYVNLAYSMYNGNAGAVYKKIPYYVIPKYKFKRVAYIEESESDTE